MNFLKNIPEKNSFTLALMKMQEDDADTTGFTKIAKYGFALHSKSMAMAKWEMYFWEFPQAEIAKMCFM